MEYIKELSETKREIYRFSIFGMVLVLTSYILEEKPKNKRNWVLINRWNSLSTQYNTISEPTISKELKEEIILKYTSELRVLSTKEWREKR